ncbi:MAG: hypothetical protein WBD46_12395 [Acidobacteriaceae bacterium]
MARNPLRVREDTIEGVRRPTPEGADESSSDMDMQLGKLIGRKIVLLGPRLLDADKNTEALQTVTLVGVDAAGIWIESEEAENRIAERFRVKPAAPAAFFIPFAQITTMIASQEAGAGEVSVETGRSAA